MWINSMPGILSHYYDVIQSDIRSRLLYYIVPTSMGLLKLHQVSNDKRFLSLARKTLDWVLTL